LYLNEKGIIMHHFIYPSQDTYITNRPHFGTLNFGVDEILQIGTENHYVSYISPTKDYVYNKEIFNKIGVQFFNGTFTGSIIGTNENSYVYLDGVLNSGIFEVNYFEGLIESGSMICLYGTASGIDTRPVQNRQYKSQSYVDRALIQFDLTSISNSISKGEIVNPEFRLKVKISNEYQLPLEYTIYAVALAESWAMGTGYMSDGGSEDGASWIYRDFKGGTKWDVPGGTLTNFICSQSFHYKSADLNMDVTPIVNQWLAGLPNYGFILLTSDELHPTGSGFLLKYFSEDTNTIYSPLLDVGWDNDWEYITSSYDTASVIISYSSGSSTTITDGSSLSGAGGVNGNFSGSAFLNFYSHYLTASNVLFTGSFVQEFTGELIGSFYGEANATGSFIGSGLFTASFTGSIDGIDTEVTNSNISGTNIEGYLLGNVSMPSYLGTFEGVLTGSALSLYGTASGYYLDENNNYYIGFISASGFSGNIKNVPVFGPVEGLISINNVNVNLPTEIKTRCATSPMESPYGTPYFPPTTNAYTFLNLEWVWGGDEVGWSRIIPIPPNACITTSCGVSHSVQLMTGSFTGGVFQNSNFTAYYENHKILFASLTGSWNSSALIGATCVIPMPQITYPHVTAKINGLYVNGTALGLYTISASISESVTQSIDSASFVGRFIDGPLNGGYVTLQLTGSATTSSFAYTSSVNFTSSCLQPLNVEKPFSINIGNMQSEYKAGDIIKLNVFGRKKFPLKYFGISTQQEQYLVPEFLPTSSYYAIKDNQTDEIVINFDNYTRISCAYPEGNYFLVDTTSLPQERYYRVLIRIENGTQITTIDTGKTFKITR
jgi:hypothetical protein